MKRRTLLTSALNLNNTTKQIRDAKSNALAVRILIVTRASHQEP